MSNIKMSAKTENEMAEWLAALLVKPRTIAKIDVRRKQNGYTCNAVLYEESEDK